MVDMEFFGKVDLKHKVAHKVDRKVARNRMLFHSNIALAFIVIGTDLHRPA